MTGIPISLAISLAWALFPSIFITFGDGPIKVIPARSQTSANSGRSDNRPYPGWIASAPACLAIDIISLMSR